MKQFKRTKLNSAGFAHIEALVIIIVIVVIVFVGGFVYQNSADTKYHTAVKPAYDKQSTQMAVVYKSFGRPVFSSNDSTPDSDKQDLSFINTAIQDAQSETNNLTTQNKLMIVPGLSWMSSVSKTSKENTAVKQYINDSNAFLTNYQTLSTYVTQLEKIENTQLTAFTDSVNQVSDATSLTELSTTTGNASKKLSTTIDSLRTLKPTSDVQKINTDLINDLDNMNTDLKNIAAGADAKNSAAISSAANKLVQDSTTLEAFAGTDVASILQGDSQIHQQITKLEAEKPLQ